MRALAVAWMLALAGPLFAAGKTEVIAAPFEDVWKATLAVVAELFTLESVNEDSGVISFRHGTEDGSVLLVRATDTTTSMTVNVKAARMGSTMGSFGAKKSRNKIPKEVRKRLGLKEGK